MNDLPEQLKPLALQLYRRLEFRLEPLRTIISGIRNKAASQGQAVGGAVIERLLTAFQAETELRLNTIEQVLRTYRVSCSPSLIVQHGSDLSGFMQQFVIQQCRYIQAECEQAIKPVVRASRGREEVINKLCLQRFTDVTRNALGLIDGVVQEIVVAAKMDVDASSREERPSYVYQTTVHGSIGGFAQGGSSIGSVEQKLHNETESPEVIGLLREALGQIQDLKVRHASLEALSTIELAQSPASKLNGYKNLISSLADHVTVLVPFLPALTSLIPGG